MTRQILRGVFALAALCACLPASADIGPPGDPCDIDPTLAECAGREENAADDVFTHEDYHKKLRSAEMVSPLGSDVFGEGVSLYNGATEFTAVDIDLPGDNGLPVQLRRRFDVQSRKTEVFGGFGAWDIDVPYLYGVFDGVHKWNEYGNPLLRRCSSKWRPQVQAGFNVWDIWAGNQMHIPGQGDREILNLVQTTNPVPSAGGPYYWTTRDNFRFSCKPATANGYPGESFVALDADGTRYTFDVVIERGHGMVNLIGLRHARKRVYFMASEVLDRHGNWVRYHYSGDRLTGITSSDNRSIQLTYTENRITQATAHGRSWSYVYPAGQTIGFPANAAARWLSDVVRPDGSRWTYAFSHTAGMGALRPFYPKNESGDAWCPEADPAEGNFTLAVTHPAGAKGTFRFDVLRHYRAGVTQNHCAAINNTQFAMGVADYGDVYSLTKKTVEGPGVAPMVWSYLYGGGAYSRPPSPLPCTGAASDVSKTTTVTHPDSTRQAYQFGVQHDCNDGRLLSTKTLSSTNAVLRLETHTYVTEAEAPSMPFSNLYGTMSGSQDPSTSRNRPIKSTLINQQSVNFGSTVNVFDNFARPKDVTKASPFGNKREYTSYYDVLNKWVVGQIYNIRVQKDDVDTWPLGRLFDSVTHFPKYHWSFGKLVDARTYDAAGRLLTISDPSNTKFTTLTNYYRGVPRSIVYHDGSSESAAVSDHGEITSVTDALGNKTTYGYDLMGRLSGITYPAGDSTAWTPTTIKFENVAGFEYGLPANHWRQTISTGNARKVTYFDGLWRPVLSAQYDMATETPDRRMVQRRFDHANRETFVSYPRHAISSYIADVNGMATTYDALSRPITSTAASEQGPLKTSYAYISLFRTQATDPKNNITTTRYQAFDQPTTDAPTLVQTSAGTSTTITRDIFGKPTHIQRSGLWNGSTLFADRRFVYDDNQRLCKTYDPEAAWTVMDYDASNNIAWTGTGLTSGVNSVSLCQREAVATGDKSSRSYDGRNRLVTIDHPSGTDDVTHTYFADGALKTIATPTGGTWTYAYNKRRLMTSENLAVNGLSLWNYLTYNGNGHVSHFAPPGGVLTPYSPNALGEPTQVGTFATGITYHPNGAVKGFTYGNFIAHSQELNLRQLPLRRLETYGATTFMDLTHSYDKNANLTGLLDNDGDSADQTRSIDYDALDRLIYTDAPGVLGKAAYTYDPLDNLREIDFAGGARTPQTDIYRYNSQNRLFEIYRSNTNNQSETVLYDHDKRGNMVLRSGQTHEYDRANRMTSAKVGGTEETYKYDGHGRRTLIGRAAGITTQFYSRNGQLLYERGPAGNVTRHLHLGNRLLATVVLGTTFYQHTDTLGSIVKRTNASRVVVGTTIYEPYGSLAGNSTYDQRPGFTGHVTDAATTLSYMQQRYYDSTAMRFLSVDPMPTSMADGSNFNRYWYANNNPYKFIDPDGREAGSAFQTVNDMTAGQSITAPGRTGPMSFGEKMIAGGLMAVAAPIVALAGAEAGMAALANPAAATNAINAVAEVGAGEALGGAALVAAAGKITGYTRHAINQAISRDGGKGVAPKAILDAVKNPTKVTEQAGGKTKFEGANARVVLNNEGKVVTVIPRNSDGVRSK